MRRILTVPLLLLGLAHGRAQTPTSLPTQLGDTGFHSSAARPYSPQYPLWSDGAEKARRVFLPPGTTLDVRNPEAFGFPVGTKFWKTFSFAGRKVETRLMWKRGETDWVYGTYLWNEAGTDAELAPDAGLPKHTALPGGGFHSIPSIADCKACHENAGVEVLGFNALQLSTDRDPLAPHAEPLQKGMVTLATLEREQRLSPRRPEWVSTPPRIQAETPRQRAILGYFSVNCGSCHQAAKALPRIDLDLRHPLGRPGRESPVLKSALGISSRWEIPGSPRGASQRLKPGDPALSSVLHRMTKRTRASQMPPIGTAQVDEAAVALVRAWIQEDLK